MLFKPYDSKGRWIDMYNNLLLIGENISHYYNEYKILNNINCQFEKNSITVIKGKSGSGKSTLLQILSGLEKPQNGVILYKGKNMYRLQEKKLAGIRGRKIGFIFQEFHLIPDLSVEKNILLPMELNKLDIDYEKLHDLCKELDIFHLIKKKVRLLSGGEKQRVAIARALLKKPEILFADEPTGNLDLRNTNAIIEILEQLIVDQQVTLIVVTHEKELFNLPHKEFELINGTLIECVKNG